MPDPERTKLREQLRKYAEAAESSDWEALDTSGRSDDARDAITEMYRILGNQPNASSNPVTGEFVSQLTVLANNRNQRVLDAEPHIPPLLWVGLTFGGLVLVTLTGFMRLDSKLGHVALSSAVAILLGLLLYIVYWLDHPFGTKVGVTPEPFRHSIEVFDITDRGA